MRFEEEGAMKNINGINNYEIKKKIVLAGGSRIFNNWKAHSNITQEGFLRELKWLCEDPMDSIGRLTRQLGCDEKRGLVRLRRNNGEITVFYEEDGWIWNGPVSISAFDRI